MTTTTPYRFGIIGFGNIGTGTVQTLLSNRDQIQRMAGRPIELTAIADIDWSRDRGVALEGIRKETDGKNVAQANDVDAIVELIGGTTIAKEMVLAALNAGKDVITANKALLAVHGAELFKTAQEKGRSILFEASVGGGIPLIQSFNGGMSAAQVTELYGIVNGTCNFILSAMAKEGREYQDVLDEAIQRGYAEPDPTFDVEGIDAAHKVSILASLLFNTAIDINSVHTEGINHVTLDDIRFGERLGYTLKLLAIAKDHGDRIEARVHPTFIAKNTVLASVSGSYNAVYTFAPGLEGTLLYGRGAGPLPTGNAILSDLIQLARQQNGYQAPDYSNFWENRKLMVPIGQMECCYYLKFIVDDRPGVLAQLAGVLGECGISILSVLQMESEGNGTAPLVMMTHESLERQVKLALDRINALTVCRSVPRFIRVEQVPS